MAGLNICLMGTIEVSRDGAAVELPGRRVRALLAMLALSADQFVSTERLAEGLWDDVPPQRVRGSLQTYVGRLRRAIGADRVVTRPSGYALRVDREEVDLLQFYDRVEAAARCVDPLEERDALAAALAAWRAEPFGEAPSIWLARYESPLWVERHLQAVERRVDLDLLAGDHARCATELQELAERNPLRESIWLRWLLALQGCGRTAEGLTHYETLRNRLVEELGTVPQAALQALHRELLETPAPPEPSSPAVVVPSMLPPAVSGFTGRTAQLAELETLTTSTPSPSVVAVHGPAGTGKTSLALHWAHGNRRAFPDGQLFVDLAGFGPDAPLGAAEALGVLLGGLGVRRRQLPSGETERAALWRSLLAERRALVVLDNARDSAQVRPLLPGGPSLVLVTSRSQLRSLAARDGAGRVVVEPMPADESTDLLAHRLRVTAPNDPALTRLAELCDHLPLALALAAEQIGRGKTRSLAEQIERLHDRRHRLRSFTAWDDDPSTSLRAVLDWSYRTLDEEAARVLRLSGLGPESRISTETVGALARIDPALAERALDRLADCHLLSARRDGWWEMHDLVRDYAEDLTLQEDSEEDREAAVRRLRSWYTHTARNAAAMVGAVHQLIELDDPEPGVRPNRFIDSRHAFLWFLAHRRGLTTMITRAAEAGDHEFVYTTVPLLSALLGTGGGLREELHLHTVAEASARAAGDDLAEAICATHLGMTYGRSQQFDPAQEWFTRARDLFARAGHRAGELHVMMTLGIVVMHLGDLDRSIGLLEDALTGARRHGLDGREAAVSNNLALAYARRGRYDEAVPVAERAVAAHRRLGNHLNHAMALDSLGVVHLLRGAYAEARAVLLEGLELHRDVGENVSHAATLKDLGRAEDGLGEHDLARRLWTDALEMMDRVDGADSADISRAELRSLLGEGNT
ncbi:MAG TPA: tetratricopeptide repeat protein [Nocardioides sp.]|nr:tetratricopeptide repeat protein [Nocardioides sp.]